MPKERLFEDTDEDAERVLIDLTRATPIWKKFEQVVAATALTRKFALAGLRARYPDATEQELKLRLGALVLDRDTMIKVYGWDPEVRGY